MLVRSQPRQHTARVMSETIDELESEFEDEGEDYFDSTLAANKFKELMSALDVEESTQELAVAILKEEGLQAVQVRRRRPCFCLDVVVCCANTSVCFGTHTSRPLCFSCMAPLETLVRVHSPWKTEGAAERL